MCVLSVYTRSSSTGGRGMGPTQLKRHLEKQAELLSEARRILEKELECLQVSNVWQWSFNMNEHGNLHHF